MQRSFSEHLDEDGRHVLNAGVLSVLCIGFAFVRTLGAKSAALTDGAFLIGIVLGMIGLYHGRRLPTRFREAYSAGYVLSIITVSCGVLGLLLNFTISGSLLG